MDTRKVLCVCLGMPSSQADPLRQEDWDVIVVKDLAGARRVLAHQHVPVGLLMTGLLQADHMLEQLAELEAYLHLSAKMEWVGVFHGDTLDLPLLRELVLNYFFDFHTWPLDGHELKLTLDHALRRAMLRVRDDEYLQHTGSMGMVGHSAAIVRLRQQIRKVAATDAPVLIGGESGTGKELAARAIHQASTRAAGPWVAVNCGAMAPSLIQSELFGHERGAFTGAMNSKQGLIEAANGGTIFLDEIGDLPLELQTNLLRFLQERTISRVGSTHSLSVDVRVVAATHVDLASAVAAGRFREDLFYRLHVLPIVAPPLRERLTDIPLLAQHFFQRSAAKGYHRRVDGFSHSAMTALMAHHWPGNIRELCNRIECAMIMTDQRLIMPSDLGLGPGPLPAVVGLEAVRTLAERDAIELTLGRVARNITHAARELGVSRMTLYRLIDKHGLSARPHSN